MTDVIFVMLPISWLTRGILFAGVAAFIIIRFGMKERRTEYDDKMSWDRQRLALDKYVSEEVERKKRESSGK